MLAVYLGTVLINQLQLGQLYLTQNYMCTFIFFKNTVAKYPGPPSRHSRAKRPIATVSNLGLESMCLRASYMLTVAASHLQNQISTRSMHSKPFSTTWTACMSLVLVIAKLPKKDAENSVWKHVDLMNGAVVVHVGMPRQQGAKDQHQPDRNVHRMQPEDGDRLLGFPNPRAPSI